MSIRNLNPQVKLTCKIIATLLWVCIVIMCYLPSWGGYNNGYDIFDVRHHYFEGNMFDVSGSVSSAHLILCWVIIICSAIALITVWTQVKTGLLAASVLQTVLMTANYFIVDNRFGSQIYELGLIQLIITFAALALAVLLSVQERGSK